MPRSKSERQRRIQEFEIHHCRLRMTQIETMIAEFDRICFNLGHQIEIEEMRARVTDPTHFAYPTSAKAARKRCAKLLRSADALKLEHARLRSVAAKRGQVTKAWHIWREPVDSNQMTWEPLHTTTVRGAN